MSEGGIIFDYHVRAKALRSTFIMMGLGAAMFAVAVLVDIHPVANALLFIFGPGLVIFGIIALFLALMNRAKKLVLTEKGLEYYGRKRVLIPYASIQSAQISAGSGSPVLRLNYGKDGRKKFDILSPLFDDGAFELFIMKFEEIYNAGPANTSDQ